MSANTPSVCARQLFLSFITLLRIKSKSVIFKESAVEFAKLKILQIDEFAITVLWM